MSLQILINVRKYQRKLVTENVNRRESFATLPPGEKLNILESISSYAIKLKELDFQIQEMLWNETEDENKLETDLSLSEEYQSKVIQCINLLKEIPTVRSPTEGPCAILKRSVSPLPKFTRREGENITNFFSEFEDTIGFYNYSGYEKLLLLKQQLSGIGRFFGIG